MYVTYLHSTDSEAPRLTPQFSSPQVLSPEHTRLQTVLRHILDLPLLNDAYLHDQQPHSAVDWFNIGAAIQNSVNSAFCQ